MSWYYTREAGPEGQVLTDEGIPSGANLTNLLKTGPLPVDIGLEIIAFLADILTIAEEDKTMHGDINPGDVYVDARGSVSLSGYGEKRMRGRAPEGTPRFLVSDVYGLGIVLHSLLSREPMGVIPRDRDGHDDAIVDRLLAIDWSGLQNIAGRDPVVHFLCSMLAFDPSERPTALDVANILSQVASQLQGEGIESWASHSIGGSSSPAPPTVEDVLEAPQALGKVFNQTGQFSRRQTASSKGECTAFWSREKISAMLDEGEDQLASSQMFQRRDLADKLTPSGLDTIPPQAVTRSARSDGAGAYPEETPWSPDSTITGKPEDPNLRSAIAALRTQDAPSSSPPPIATGPTVGSSSGYTPPPVSAPPQRQPAAKPFPWLAVVLGAVGMGMLFVMIGVAGLVYYYMEKQSAAEATVTVEEPAPVLEPEPEPEPVEIKPERRTRPAKRAAAPRTQSRPARRTPPPAVQAPNRSYEVTFRSMGAEAQFVCGDGQSGRFVGVTRREFTDITTCRITIEDAVGAIQLRQASVVNCTKAGTAVTCTGT